MKNSYRFSEKDMDAAWPIWFRSFEDQPITRQEEHFMVLAFEAERFNQQHKEWPTVAQVLEFIEHNEQEEIKRRNHQIEMYAKSKATQ